MNQPTTPDPLSPAVRQAIREHAFALIHTELALLCQRDLFEETTKRLEACYRRGLADGRSPQWQPITSAPQDGTDVLLCWYDGIAAPMFAVGYNLGSFRRWQTTHRWLHNDQSWPTHWLPLPLPPTGEDAP